MTVPGQTIKIQLNTNTNNNTDNHKNTNTNINKKVFPTKALCSTATTTVSGRTCQEWALDTPHSHS